MMRRMAADVLPPFAGLVEGFTLISELGRGGFGQVWKATGPGGFPVAMKYVRLDQRAAQLEIRSLELMREIRHPYLLGLFGAWHREGWLIVAMELADGTLWQRHKQLIAAGEPGIPREDLLQRMDEAARGLDHLNSLSIQHRDVKPQNLLLVGGSVKVADFGLAKVLENSLGNNTGAMTPAYAAPEFLEGKTSPRSDQYALGITYYQLGTGKLPFTGNLAQVLEGHRRRAPDLSLLPVAADRTALERALAKDPAARWPSCTAFVAALRGQGVSGPGQSEESSGTYNLVDEALPLDPTVSALPVRGTTLPRSSRTKAKRTEEKPPNLFFRMAGALAQIDGRLVAGVLGLLMVGLVTWFVYWFATMTPEDVFEPQAGSSEPLPAMRRTPVRNEFTNSIGMVLAPIRAGEFEMGPADSEAGSLEDEKPRHRVVIERPFFMGVYEVTNAEWVNVMRGHLDIPENSQPAHPVQGIEPQFARRFCKLLSERPDEHKAGRTYRLPTEEEWEYACRAGSRTAFHFGESLSAGQANFLGSEPYGQAPKLAYPGRTTPVGSYPPNAWGLFDMHGNVAEWCAGSYNPNAYKEDPTPPRDNQGRAVVYNPVARGGNYAVGGQFCRSAFRGFYYPGLTDYAGRGLRVVCEVGPAREASP
jgi:formylglycine-generating enzyme required for sulfatase activity